MDLLIFCMYWILSTEETYRSLLDYQLSSQKWKTKDFLIYFYIFLVLCMGSLAEDTVLRSC